MLRVLILITVILLNACSSTPKGVSCPGEVATIYGQPIGKTEGRIFDLVNTFSVSKGSMRINSGPLHSYDRHLYIPSSVTAEGYTAQRLSNKQFRLINPFQDTMITWTCP